MKINALRFLACPECLFDLRITEHIGEEVEILRGRLLCRNGHSFRIVRGVPSLYRKTSDPRTVQTVKAFDEKWSKVPCLGKKADDFFLKWYAERYGFKSKAAVLKHIRGMTVLDAGTGTGRDARFFSLETSSTIFAVDLSNVVYYINREATFIPNLHIVRADINRLPFKPEIFDLISCDQVLHHLADPEAALKRLSGLLRRNGEILFYVYRKKGPVREFCDTYLRRKIGKLPFDEAWRFAESMTELGRALSEAATEITVPHDISLLELKTGRFPIQRFFHWNIFKCFWNKDFDWKTNVAINFDWYRPRYAHKFRRNQAAKMAEEAGLSVKYVGETDSGISVRAVKP